MGEPSPGTSPAERSEGRLDSWKEIAAHFNRDVTTVQRWEKREGMPVHRHQLRRWMLGIPIKWIFQPPRADTTAGIRN